MTLDFHRVWVFSGAATDGFDVAKDFCAGFSLVARAANSSPAHLPIRHSSGAGV